MTVLPSRPVLCAVGLDDRAGAVLRTARDLAGRLAAPLRVLHVHEPPVAAPIAVAAGGGALAAAPLPVAVPATAWTALAARGVAPEEVLVRTGDVEACALEVVRQLRPEYAVVGTSGRGVVRAAARGSVSRALARDAGCPVVVLPPHAPGGVQGGLVLCAVSLDDDAARTAIACAAALARRSGGRLVLVHAAELPGAMSAGTAFAALGPMSAGASKRRGLARLREVAHMAGGVDVALEPRLGDAATAVVDAAGACGAAVVVTATRGRGLAGEALLGSVARRIAREAPCPVVVARA